MSSINESTSSKHSLLSQSQSLQSQKPVIIDKKKKQKKYDNILQSQTTENVEGIKQPDNEKEMTPYKRYSKIYGDKIQHDFRVDQINTIMKLSKEIHEKLQRLNLKDFTAIEQYFMELEEKLKKYLSAIKEAINEIEKNNYSLDYKTLDLEICTPARILAKNYKHDFLNKIIPYNNPLYKRVRLYKTHTKETKSQFLICVQDIHEMCAFEIMEQERFYSKYISRHNHDFPLLWDNDIPKPSIDLSMLKEYTEVSHKYKTQSDIFFNGSKSVIDFLEEKISHLADVMMNILLEEDNKKKEAKQGKKKILLPISSQSSHEYSVFDDEKDEDEIETETLGHNLQNTSLNSSSETEYNQKLQAQWKNYFKHTDYRKGAWDNKKEIAVPFQEGHFPSQMQFMLSANAVIEHLKKRHPDVIQTLSKEKKGKIEDKDGFELVKFKDNKKDIHNLIFELAHQLSDKETFIYKSEFYIHPETNEKIPNPTIMVRGKNKDNQIMISVWGLYEAEKGDDIKLHLVSYYKDDNPNKKLPHAMKISKFADKIHQETEADTSKKLTDADAELIALFADGEALQKTKAQFEQIKKGKGKKKKS